MKKKGNFEIKNYRPVSNLPFLSKVLEKCIQEQFMDYCEENKLNSDYQFANKKSHSCETLLLKLINDLLWEMENSKISNILMCDLSGAFDMVDHEVLMNVLESKFGVQDNAKKLLQSFLSPRSFKVNVGDVYSETKTINYSVPQGSINGPVLWNVYSSTIHTAIDDNINIFAFADDHTLQNSAAPKLEALQQSQSNLNNTMLNVQNWMNTN